LRDVLLADGMRKKVDFEMLSRRRGKEKRIQQRRRRRRRRREEVDTPRRVGFLGARGHVDFQMSTSTCCNGQPE